MRTEINSPPSSMEVTSGFQVRYLEPESSYSAARWPFFSHPPSCSPRRSTLRSGLAKAAVVESRRMRRKFFM